MNIIELNKVKSGEHFRQPNSDVVYCKIKFCQQAKKVLSYKVSDGYCSRWIEWNQATQVIKV